MTMVTYIHLVFGKINLIIIELKGMNAESRLKLVLIRTKMKINVFFFGPEL